MATSVKLTCQRKVGGTTCGTRASGVFEIETTKGTTFFMLLCADCGFTKMVNTVRMFTPEDGEPVFYKPFVAIRLMKSLNSEFNQNDAPYKSGAKHWVEGGPSKPLHPHSVVAEKVLFSPATPPSIPSGYLESLRRHDDGK